MAEPVPGIIGGDGVEGFREFFVDGGGRARLGRAQGGLELGPTGLDRREVGRVARQGQEMEAGAFEEDARLRHAVSGEIVHDDGGPWLVLLELRDQDLLQEGLEHGPVGGGGHGHDGDEAAERERPQHRHASPVAGGAAAGALAARRARIKPRQLGADAGLVKEDEVLGRELLDRLPEGGALGGDVRALLFARAERLFF